MRKTEYIDIEHAALFNTEGLQKYLSCGRSAAVAIGIKAEARIQEGRRVLWNRAKVDRYINSKSE